MKAWINGEFKGWDQATVPILSHSFGRGSAIFEVFDITSTPKGPAFFCLEQHIDRLCVSADLTYMTLPHAREEIVEACIETAATNGVENGFTKLFAYYPGIEFGVYPRNREVHLAIFCIDYSTFGITREMLSAPVAVGITRFRKFHPDTIPIHAKVCGSYVNGYLATADVIERGYDDVINLSLNGCVAESATASAFFVRDGVLVTAKSDGVLKGITRAVIIDIADSLEQPVEERDIPAAELSSIEEAFFAVSMKRIQPIVSIDGEDVGARCPGPITQSMAGAIDAVYDGTNPKYESWLTYCRPA